ncbi:MAG: hypothetical protein IK099_06510 [Clostridia bacterium]|nr:hypothetical protein [Clostridia bacterium]
MEGFAWIAIVGLWWLFATVMKGYKASQKAAQNQHQAAQAPKAKAAPQAKPAASPAPRPAAMSRQDEWEDEEDSWDERDARRGSRQPVVPTVTARAQTSAAAKHSDAKPFEAHMHTPVMGVEGEGTEGIDCCHEFMLGGIEDSEPADFLPMQEEDQSQRAKALLQGVIYSEILKRRAVRRYHVKQS